MYLGFGCFVRFWFCARFGWVVGLVFWLWVLCIVCNGFVVCVFAIGFDWCVGGFGLGVVFGCDGGFWLCFAEVVGFGFLLVNLWFV